MARIIDLYIDKLPPWPGPASLLPPGPVPEREILRRVRYCIALLQEEVKRIDRERLREAI